MNNFNRMTIRHQTNKCVVLKLKRYLTGTPTDMAFQRESWAVSPIATVRFCGSEQDCMTFIRNAGAQFQEEQA